MDKASKARLKGNILRAIESMSTEINDRAKRVAYLRARSDSAYSDGNSEQWEAYDERIQLHQNKMELAISKQAKFRNALLSLSDVRAA